MTTRLEIAEKKLDRLKASFEPSPMAHAPLGQPLHLYKASGRAMARKLERHNEKMFKLTDEIKKQEEYVEILEEREYKKANGLTSNYGLAKTVENLPRWKKRVERLEFIRDYNKSHGLKVATPYENEKGDLEFYSSQKLKDAKDTVANLENILNQVRAGEHGMNEAFQTLVNDGSVRQWAKKPKYYFVKGLRKVALEYSEEMEGFIESPRYPSKNDDERKALEIFRNCGAIK